MRPRGFAVHGPVLRRTRPGQRRVASASWTRVTGTSRGTFCQCRGTPRPARRVVICPSPLRPANHLATRWGRPLRLATAEESRRGRTPRRGSRGGAPALGTAHALRPGDVRAPREEPGRGVAWRGLLAGTGRGAWRACAKTVLWAPASGRRVTRVRHVGAWAIPVAIHVARVSVRGRARSIGRGTVSAGRRSLKKRD